jgi:rubredoxin
MNKDYDDEIPFDSGYDPNSDAWFANLLFWRPSKLSDEQMQINFSGRDGRWSLQTKRALDRFRARGLDLNENWALCPPYWSCPTCRRSKDNIFRLSKRGILLAKLELHHDHLRDGVYHRAQELFGTEWRETVPKTSIGILDQIRDITSRFDQCLLCSECNAADGKVKTRFRSEIDFRFTFTAVEIGAFVRARATQDHDIDYAKAFELWQAEKDNFLARIKLIDELLTYVKSGRLARDYLGVSGARDIGSAFTSSALLAQSFSQETKDTERAALLWNFGTEFLGRSTQRDSAKLPPTDALGRPTVLPTDDEYAAYVDPVSGKRWQATPEDWKCLVCERGKRQILRKSKAGKWTGGVRSRVKCTLETNTHDIANRRRLFPDFRNDLFVKDAAAVTLCSDCAGIGAALGQWDQSIRDPYLGIDDLRACISLSHPNGAHEIDFDVARQRAIANESYGPAWAAFHAFQAKVGDFGGRFDHCQKFGGSKQDLLEDLAEDIRVFHRIDSVPECNNLVTWLLAQHAAVAGKSYPEL